MTQILQTYATLAAADEFWKLRERSQDIAVQGSKLVRFVDNLDIQTADDFYDLVAGESTVTSPVVDGETLSGTFSNSAVSDRDIIEREGIIEQTLIAVSSVTTAVGLGALKSRPAQKNEIFNLFGFEQGEGDTGTLVFENIDPASRDELMGLSDDSLVTSVWARAGVSAWVTGTAYVVGDLVVESNVVYHCIVNHTSGVFATDLNVNNYWRAYGSTYASNTAYKADEVVVYSSAFYRVVADYTSSNTGDNDDDFAADFANGDLAVSFEYSQRDFRVLENNTGQFTILFEAKDWRNTWSVRRLLSEGNGAGRRRSNAYTVDGVRTDDAETVRSGMSAESGFAIASTSATETGNGKARVSSRQVKINAEGDAVYETTYRPVFGRNNQTVVQRWTSITETLADQIVADAKANEDSGGFTYSDPGAGYLLREVSKVQHDSDPLFDVIRITHVPSFGAEVQPVAVDGIQEAFVQSVKWLGVSTSDYENVKWRWWVYEYDLAYSTSESQAKSATDESLAGPHMRSRVWQSKQGLWASIKIVDIKIGAWDTGDIDSAPPWIT